MICFDDHMSDYDEVAEEVGSRKMILSCMLHQQNFSTMCNGGALHCHQACCTSRLVFYASIGFCFYESIGFCFYESIGFCFYESIGFFFYESIGFFFYKVQSLS